MRRTFAAIVIATALAGFAPAPASAQVIGPVCFAFSGFTNEFRMFFTPTGANHFAGTGRDITSGNLVSATVAIVGSTAMFGYTRPMHPTSTTHSTFGSAAIALASGTGPGRCEAINTATGCGTGTDFTISIVPCPPLAEDSVRAAPPTGRSMDGTDDR